MTDVGELTYFLGLEFAKSESGMILHQTRYISEVLKKFNMKDYNPTATPVETGISLTQDESEKPADSTLFKQLMGSLRYICNSRLDISFAIGLINRFMSEPKQSHLLAAKRVLRYLKGTSDFGILFPKVSKQDKVELVGISNSDWFGDNVDRRSTVGYVFKLHGALVCWCSKKQAVVALSSCEAQYIVACHAA